MFSCLRRFVSRSTTPPPPPPNLAILLDESTIDLSEAARGYRAAEGSFDVVLMDVDPSDGVVPSLLDLPPFEEEP